MSGATEGGCTCGTVCYESAVQKAVWRAARPSWDPVDPALPAV